MKLHRTKKIIRFFLLVYVTLLSSFAYGGCIEVDDGLSSISIVCEGVHVSTRSEAESVCLGYVAGYINRRDGSSCGCLTQLGASVSNGCRLANNLLQNIAVVVTYDISQPNPPEPPTGTPPSSTQVPPKTAPGCNSAGNPCQVSTGAKTQTEVDFSGGLGFSRSYQTLNLVDVGFGKGWRSSFQQQLSISGDSLYIIEQSGRGDPWHKVNGVWEGDIDSDYLLSKTGSGFTVTDKRGGVMDYDHEGRLLNETDAQGKTKSYVYDSENRLITVTNNYGVSISFAYSVDGKNHVINAINSGNEIYRYEYDVNDNLIAVIYPDTTIDPNDNPRQTYHYEDADFPNHLTGITDTKSNRYGTYTYDNDGKAILTEHAQTTNGVGQQRFQLNYSARGVN